ncbi:MAG TPA: nicotinate-nucleotide adenylyltransferase [Virgibacillus sp.]|nr:nicotinate-nucleotide adenylyltransferase [Virgibacillus sp.]
MKNIGILGGTFDPPHIGHLIIAEAVRERISLEKVWFMPSYEPPHKQNAYSSVGHRLNMLELSLRDNPYFSINEIETKRHEKSYTVDTMEELTKQEPDSRFHFIIGADMVEYLPHWKNIDRIIELVTFIGVKRAGYHIHTHYPVKEVEVPMVNISSTMLRNRIHQQKSVKYLIPDKVQEYIKEHHLYE